MGLLEKFKLFKHEDKETWSQRVQSIAIKDLSPKAAYNNTEYQVIDWVWDGEKTTGELGAPLSYQPDYTGLSFRSWQAFTESDLAQILVKATVNWVIGSGLKLQSEPYDSVILDSGFRFDKNSFVKGVEDRFRLYTKTNDSVHNKMYNFNKIQRLAYFNAIVGGDVLCVMRIGDNNLPTMQIVDGVFVQNPGMDYAEQAKNRGNEIVHGIELDADKRHIAFYVAKKGGEHQRIEAFGEKAGEMAFMLYGSDYRIDSVRGMPLLSAVLEKIKKLDRYNEAIVGGAEERAKVPWTFEHNANSTGENPDMSKLTGMFGDPTTITTGDNVNVVDMTRQTTAIRRTYEKEPINLPVGASLKTLATAMETGQEAFTTGNFIYICAALETPYEVALMKYVNSFSSSRMASQSYLQILNIKRTLFNDAFNNKYFNLFLDTQILDNKIKADGYTTARNKKDIILLQAYRNARFTGPGVPQADPSKEVKAVTAQIDANLLTRDEAIERLGNKSDFTTTIDKLSEEERLIKEKIPQPVEQTQNNQGTI